MQEQLSQTEIEDKSNTNTSAAASERRQTISPFFAAGAVVFAVALVTAICFHLNAAVFNQNFAKKVLCFDAQQYLFDCSRICNFLLAALHGKLQLELISDPAFALAIQADGPVFPSFFALIFLLLGHAPGIQDCRTIEIVQSALHAFSALLIYSLSLRLTSKNLLAALFAGIAWALYPAAIFWSGVFYTETTVICFALLFVLLLSSCRNLGKAFFAGIMAGLVALLKPALLPAAGLSALGLSYFNRKISLAVIVLGIALALAPWAIYTKASTGKASITAQRYPAFNLALGADTEVDAAFAAPPPPLTSIFSLDNNQPFAFPLAQWQYRSSDMLRLAGYKLHCLWFQQSNDFRQNFFGLAPALQNYWHRFLLFLGIAGLLHCFFSGRIFFMDQTQRTVALSAFFFLGTHLFYLLFTPIARYSLTATPFMLIFAAYLIADLQCFFNRSASTKSPAKESPQSSILSASQLVPAVASLSIAALALAGLNAGKSLASASAQNELSYKLAPGDSARKLINLRSVTEPSGLYAGLLLIDADKEIESAKVFFNGKVLPGKPQALRNFNSTLYKQAFELRSLAYPLGLSTEQLRQWRAVELPLESINWQGENLLEIKQEERAAEIYADPTATRRIASPDYFAVNNLPNSETSNDLRVLSPIMGAGIMQESSISRSSGEKQELGKASLRVRLALARAPKPFSKAADSKPADADKAASILLALNPKSFDLYLQDPEINGIRTNRFALKAARSSGTVLPLPRINASSNLKVKVHGELLAMKTGSKASVVIALQPALASPALVLSSTPEIIAAKSSWQEFSVEDQLPRSLLNEKQELSAHIAVYPGPWLDFCGYPPDGRCGDIRVRNLRIELEPVNCPDFAGKQILYY